MFIVVFWISCPLEMIWKIIFNKVKKKKNKLIRKANVQKGFYALPESKALHK